MTGFNEDDREWLAGREKQTFQEMPLGRRRARIGAYLLADVVEHAPGPEPKKVTDTMQEYALRTGGAITKEENDLIVQWAVKAKETAQDLEQRMERHPRRRRRSSRSPRARLAAVPGSRAAA